MNKSVTIISVHKHKLAGETWNAGCWLARVRAHTCVRTYVFAHARSLKYLRHNSFSPLARFSGIVVTQLNETCVKQKYMYDLCVCTYTQADVRRLSGSHFVATTSLPLLPSSHDSYRALHYFMRINAMKKKQREGKEKEKETERLIKCEKGGIRRLREK